ncbi:hypothetical protein MMC24_003243 [Lignoscripta atroalba]|nr:hypothetical protein [Lignoscripta atroalba]
MKGAIYAIAASALLGSAVAGALHDRRHAHEVFHLRRDHLATSESATCACTTSYSTWYGEATLIQPNTTMIHATSYITVSPEAATSTIAPYSSSAEAAVYSSSSAPTPPPMAPSSSTEAAVHIESSAPPPPPMTTSSDSSIYYPPAPPPSSAAAPENAVSSSSPPPPASSSPSTYTPPAVSGSQWCMTYSPYTDGGTCKDEQTIQIDIALIASKGFSSIRLYSTDCSGLQYAGAAAQSHNLKLVLGIYISKTGTGPASEQVGHITAWANGNYASVEMIVIGNEAVFNHFCSASQLAEFISSAKSTLQAAGYAGPVTTTETLDVLQVEANAALLCPVVDVLAANIHPFFNSGTDASSAGTFVATALAQLADVCPGDKEVFNLETGWPHSGNANGLAVPGVEEQQIAVKAIQEMAGGKSVFFSFVDDMWKEPGDLGVERSWGCSQLFGGQ